MGNCLHRVEPSFSLDKNRSQFFLSDYNGNFSYEDNGSYEFPDDYSMDLAAPCHSCHLLDESSLPFFILTSVLGVLASGAVLFALLRPLFHWQICPGWPILAQLAVGSALFSTAVPILAPGLSNAHNSALCGLGYWVWYSSAFAQALIIGCYSCMKPKLGAGQIPSLTLRLTVGLWGVAALLGLPITFATDTHNGLCTLASSRGLGALKSTHAAICFTIFTLLPVGILVAKGLIKALGMGPAPWVSILWVWYIFWLPHGVVLVFDTLVSSKVLLLPTCPAQQSLDITLHLAEALAMVHCVAAPMLLALLFHQTTHTSLPSPALLVRPSSHGDTTGVKS